MDSHWVRERSAGHFASYEASLALSTAAMKGSDSGEGSSSDGAEAEPGWQPLAEMMGHL